MGGKYHPAVLAVSMLPLYLGPLLGGWMGAPLTLLLALAALFLLAQLGAGKDKTRGGMPLPAFLIMLAGAQLLVVSAVFGLGSLLRLGFGPLALPLWLPLACTAIGAVIFAIRYRHDPQEAELMQAIDDATDAITRMTPPPEEGGPHENWPDENWPDDDASDENAPVPQNDDTPRDR